MLTTHRMSLIIKLQYWPLAQLAERLALTQEVVGSIPTGPAILNGDVAELADALDLGSSVFDVRVRVSPSPPI